MKRGLYSITCVCYLLFPIILPLYRQAGRPFGARQFTFIDRALLTRDSVEKNDNTRKYRHPIPSRISRSTTITYPADISGGVIGTCNKQPVDNPYDNVFHIYLPGLPSADQEIYLQYQLYGVTSHLGVPRSINDAQAIGGRFVELSKKWTAQKEAISVSTLRKGDNVIRFGLPLNATYNYQVKAVAISVEKKANSQALILVNQPDKSYYGNQAYLKGILHLPTQQQDESIKFYCDDQPVPLYNNEFEFVIKKPTGNLPAFAARLKAVFPTGKTITKTVSFTTRQVAFNEYIPREKGIKDNKHMLSNTVLFSYN